MPELHAFRGLRYDLGHVGSLSDVVAPPYDVIDAELQNALYERHPANVIRLILNRAEPGDANDDVRYARAAQFLKNWVREGVLSSDPDPAIYVYHQAFEHEGRTHLRRGFMARVRLQRFGEGNIYPHEETHAAAKADRLKLTHACRANLSQIFGLYPDPENAAQEVLEQAIQGVTPLEAVDHLQVTHRLWPVTDLRVIGEVASILGPRPIYVADGHHRYETACNYRDAIVQTRHVDAADPVNFVLMMCVSMSDPGMIVLPTHRLFRGLPDLTCEQLTEALGECFRVERVGRGPDQAEEVWAQLELDQEQAAFGFFTAADQQWVIARITPVGEQKMTEVAADHCESWQGLGVAILHRLIMDTLLAKPGLPKPEYVHLVEEVTHGLKHGDEDGSRFPLAALVMPATLEHIQTISQHAERMPAKSTYFYPKLLSGLVINPLE